jgi:alkylhydroperoxidase family enzyme
MIRTGLARLPRRIKAVVTVAEPIPPTADEIMSLVQQYALARIMENASVPTRRQRDSDFCVASHERARRESERVDAEIRRALAALERAGATTGSSQSAVDRA